MEKNIEASPSAWDFWENTLKSPKCIVAPMVDASELPFRMLCRRYGANLCYTPMFHSRLFSTSDKYRASQFTTCPEDRPLIVQFCGHDPKTLLAAAKHVEGQCDAVDRCPQGIARKGHYGAFLLKELPLLHDMVEILHKNLSVPVTCKIRLLPTIEESLELAITLQNAGCQMLAVHGRTKEQKGRYAPHADWEAIKKIKETLTIPVVANGSIAVYDDVDACLETTNAEGVMSAYGILKNPAIFASAHVPNACDIAFEYLMLCKEYPVASKTRKGHLFKLLTKSLTSYTDLRAQLAACKDLDEMIGIVKEVKKRLELSNYILPPPPPKKKRFKEKHGKESSSNASVIEAVAPDIFSLQTKDS